MRKTKTVWAYIDGEREFDVLQEALDNKMMLDDLKMWLRGKYGSRIEFKVE